MIVELSQTMPDSCRPWGSYNLIRWVPGRTKDWHSHEYYQIIHVLDGVHDVDFGDGWISMASSFLHILPPGYKHRLRTPRGHQQFGLNFTEAHDSRGILKLIANNFLSPMVMKMPLNEFVRSELSGYNPLLHDPLRDLRIMHCLDEYALNLVACNRGENETSSIEMLEFLKGKLNQFLSVDMVASHFHVSRPTLQRRVKKLFGCGVLHLQHKLKLEDAAKRLVESDVSASECAELYGYRDVFHFNKSFKRIFQQPPIRYRDNKIRHRLTLSG